MPERKPPDWGDWLTRPRWSILEGAYLRLGIEPSLEYPPTLTPKQRVEFDYFISAAVSALGSNDLPTDGVMAPGFGPGVRMMAMVAAGDLIDFAIEKGIQLPQPILDKKADLQRSPKRSRQPGPAAPPPAPQPEAPEAPDSLARSGIKRFYRGCLKDKQWQNLFDRNKEIEACLSPDTTPGGKPLYSRACIGQWLSRHGHLPKTSPTPTVTGTGNVRTHKAR